MKKADIFLITFILIISIIGMVYIHHYKNFYNGDLQLMINNDNKTEYYDLNEDREIKLHDKMTIKVENKTVQVVSSNCKGKECINMGKISRIGEQIVCAPGNVLLKIVGNDGGFDGIAK